MIQAERTGQGDLVPVHGGLAAPVDLRVSLKQRKRFLAEAERLPSVRVTRADLSTVYRLADGALSPLVGPMGAEAWHRALEEEVFLHQGRRWAWTIPLSFPLADDEARALMPGAAVAIRSEEGEIVAVVEDLEIFAWDKQKYVKSVYGTDRFDHPGGRAVESDPRTKRSVP